MKEIPLTQGRVALVDDEDFDFINQWKWYVAHGHAVHHSFGRHTRFIHMHRIIAERHGINLNGQLIDHRDGDGLNNQFNNLRVATQAQNQYNQGLAKNNKSGFKGVYWDKQYGKWRVLLRKSGETVLDRRFDNPLEAAKAYNKAAIEHFGEFARLNPV